MLYYYIIILYYPNKHVQTKVLSASCLFSTIRKCQLFISAQFSLTKIAVKNALSRFTKLNVWFLVHRTNHTLCVCFQSSVLHLPFVSYKCPPLPESVDQCPLCPSLSYLTSGIYTKCYYASHSCSFCA